MSASPPSRWRPAPSRAYRLDGWWTKSFLGEDELLYERRRRKGANGTSERWFIVTELTVERLECPVVPIPTEPRPERELASMDGAIGVNYMLKNMAFDLVEEIDFAAKECALTKQQLRLLDQIRSRAMSIRRMASGLLDPPPPPRTAADVQMTTVQ